MRLASMSGRSMQLTGVAAATFHLHDIQNQMHPQPSDPVAWDDNAAHQLLQMLSGEDPANIRRHRERKMTLRTNRKVELEAPIPPEIEKTPEFKDTFDQVKADLAAESRPDTKKDSEPVNIPTLMISAVDATKSSLDLSLSSPVSSSTSHSRQPSRSQIIETKLKELDDQLAATEEHLDMHMRFVRNVAKLMPFQKATRDRLLAAIQAKAILIMQMRLDVARMCCHRSVLLDDMVAESRIWKEVKDVALQTAKQTLQRQGSEDMHATHGGTSAVRALQMSRRPGSDSSVCESFHTAIDFGPDWPSSDDLGSSLLTASVTFGSSRPSSSGSVSTQLWLEEDQNAEPAENTGQHERFYTAQEHPAEEAEDWNKTRCAKRVSLVRIPSNLESLPVNKRLAGSLSTSKQVVEY